ncbi:MAG: type II secretion system protein [Magnetococcales bacterium]|nr:type II secretion system protein [Magnetococcales bacterium]
MQILKKLTLPSSANRQAGFSLIEIAIVLVIIGLLIGGVLKGQTMVKNSKIKRMATDTTSVQGAINSYMDSFWSLPGDDAGSATRWATAAVAGDGDGIIEGLFIPADLTANAGDETAKAWNHLYCENLIKGTCLGNVATAITLPVNSLGGSMGLADGRENTVLGMGRKVVCLRGMISEYAMVYDTQFDDGVGTTGQIRGSANNATGATTDAATAYALANRNIYICTEF